MSTNLAASPSCPMVVPDGIAPLNGNCRCDDGSDGSIASPVLAQNAVLKGIWRFEAIAPVSIQVVLTPTNKAQKFRYSRIWKVPRLVMKLPAGRLALNNMSFLAADGDLICEGLLIGLPLLRHLGIDSQTLFERERAALDGIDCSTVQHPSTSDKCDSLRRLTIACLQRVKSEFELDTEPDYDGKEAIETRPLDTARRRPKDSAQRSEEDTYPDPSLIDIPPPFDDSFQDDIANVLSGAKSNGFPDSQWSQPENFSASTLIHQVLSSLVL